MTNDVWGGMLGSGANGRGEQMPNRAIHIVNTKEPDLYCLVASREYTDNSSTIDWKRPVTRHVAILVSHKGRTTDIYTHTLSLSLFLGNSSLSCSNNFEGSPDFYTTFCGSPPFRSPTSASSSHVPGETWSPTFPGKDRQDKATGKRGLNFRFNE